MNETQPVRAWRRISTDEIALHIDSAELRRQVHATESLMLSRAQALRLAGDIYELLTEPESLPAEGGEEGPQP